MGINKKTNRLLCTFTTSLWISSALHATAPVWTYSAPNPASVTVSNGEIVTVHYTVTNKSPLPKNLILKTTGISASPCYLAVKGSSCSLTLTINGNLIPPQGINEGPWLCEEGNPSQCYQPEIGNVLKVYRTNSPPPVITYQVTPSAGAHISNMVPSSVQTVNAGSVQQFTVTADTGYAVEGSVGGTCPAGQWAGAVYTTGAITSNCTVTFSALQQQTTINSTPTNITLTTDAGHAVPVTVTNTGSMDAYNVNAILDSDNHGVSVGGTTCGSTLGHVPPNNTCVITFEMGAGGSVGATSATIQGENTNLLSLAIDIVSPVAPTLNIISPPQAARVIPVNNGSLDILIESSNPSATFNTDITVDLPPSWGADVTASYNNCIDVPPGGACMIHLEASAPFVADQITINGTHTAASLQTYVAFRYQGGLVFSAIPGGTTKVVSENNASSSPIIWSEDYAVGGDTPTSTPGPDSCEGKNDGQCNTQRILKCISDVGPGVGSCTGTPPTYPADLNTYAAGLCGQYNEGSYNDWFLPALCEWGLWADCFIDSINSNLHQFGFGNIANGTYWCSNETAGNETLGSWYLQFNGLTFSRGAYNKNELRNVRCARAFN